MNPERIPTKEVGLVAILLDKAVRQFMLYGKEHPQFSSVLRDLEARISAYFGGSTDLILDVKRNEFEWRGEPVFKLEKKENNYIQQMYIDGLRQLQFMPSVTQEDLAALVSVMGRDLHNYEVKEDDTVTMLWKKNIQTIRYQTVDTYTIDHFAVFQDLDLDEEKEGQENRDFLDQFVSQAAGANVSGLKSDFIPPESKIDDRYKTDEFDIQQSIPFSVFSEDQKEKEQLNLIVEQSEKRDHLAEVQIVFLEVLESKVGESDFKELLSSYLNTVSHFLTEGNLKKASDWLRSLRELQKDLNSKSEEKDFVDQAIIHLCSVSLFQTLAGKFASGVSVHPKDLANFLQQVGPKTCAAICELLAVIPQESLRSVIIDYLIYEAGEERDIYIQSLKRPEWILVRDMVKILGATIDEPRVMIFKFVAIHPHPEVRLEVIRIMKRFTSLPAKEFIRRGLEDGDPSVREFTFQFLARYPDTFFSKPIAREITKEDFFERSFDEKKIACTALAKCGGEAVLEFLEQVANASGSTDSHDELRVASLYGLGEVDHPEATRLLKEFSSKILRNREFREIAKRFFEKKSREKS